MALLAAAALAAAPVVGPLILLVWPTTASAGHCARPGLSGSGTSITGVVNTYWEGTGSPAASGSPSTLTLGAGSAGTAIAVGDMLLIMQMQDADIDSSDTADYGDGAAGLDGAGSTNLNNAGRHEYVRVQSVSGSAVTVVGGNGGGLIYSYRSAAATATAGRRSYQVIRVPQYVNVTLGANLTALPWNGAYGGVVAIDVQGELVGSGGSINVNGMGFRGGAGRQHNGLTSGGSAVAYRGPSSTTTVGLHGSKGEGVAGTPDFVQVASAYVAGGSSYPNGSNARGAPANAGGGGTDDQPTANGGNSGGGGGGGRGVGGGGGKAFCTATPNDACPAVGGKGGAGFVAAVDRLTMGGGGGAGTSNQGAGMPVGGLASSGAAGGGLVLIRAGRLSGASTISANGASAATVAGTDASGGGGGGGTIVVIARSVDPATSGTATATGGRGGDNADAGSPAARGPGGGGGGGFVATNFANLPLPTGGAAGTTNGGVTYGATAGASGSSGIVNSNAVPGVSSGAQCTPALTLSFNPATIAPNGVSRFRLTLSNPNPTLPMTAGATTDVYTSPVVNTATPNGASTCAAATVTATGGAGSLGVTGATIPANGSCVVEADVTAGTAGTYVDTPPAAGLTATIGGSSLRSLTIAPATLVVSAPLTAAKTSTTVSDPLNGTTNPKAIPGGQVANSVTIRNPAGGPTLDAGGIFVRDLIPAGSKLRVDDLGAAGSGPVQFVDGTPASGLSYSFAGLGAADSLFFSSDGGTTWTYTPTADAQGGDAAVTHVEVRPGGAMSPDRSFSLSYRVILK